MALPDWFDNVPEITVHDPLAALLGASDDGCLSYRYADAVRLCGHSCPTVACAWLMATAGLNALWPDGLPVRGAVSLDFSERRDSGTTGVMAAVFALLCGATDEAGFKGLGGRHDRRLAHFGAEVPWRIRMTRRDTGSAVDLDADPSSVPADPAMSPLLGRVLAGHATTAEQDRFGALWQDRVRRILQAGKEVVRISPVR